MKPAWWIVSILAVSVVILVVSIGSAALISYYLGDNDRSGWAQAVGTVLAVVSGFAGTLFQLRNQRRDAIENQNATARAAYLLTYDAFETVSDRLEAALTPPEEAKPLALRGARTTEMVTAMREFDTSKLPIELLADFIRLRSRIFAINERVAEVYREEEKSRGEAKDRKRMRRPERLLSTVRVRDAALSLFRDFERSAKSHGAVLLPLTDQPLIQNSLRG